MTHRPFLPVRLAPGLACALAACAALPAHAHVSLEWPAALAGTAYTATFQVGHGCGASPTRQVTVEIPAGVHGARPMPRPGWTVAIDRAPLATPVVHHGKPVTEDVVRITWTANTPADALDTAHYGEFVLRARLPQAPGPVYWPVRQVCAEGRHDWVQVPAPGLKAAALQAPAPVLDILPAGDAAGHSH